ncbi:hypothetical protein Tco_0256904 [Tanacetum coccineum]
MSTSTHPIIILSDSDVEDAFSSTDYTPASPDYSPASPGNTSSDSKTESDPSEDLSEDHSAPLAITPFPDDLLVPEERFAASLNVPTSYHHHFPLLIFLPHLGGIEIGENYQTAAARQVHIITVNMALLPPGFIEPLYPDIMAMINAQDIEHIIPPTPPRDTDPPVGSPIPSSPSSSVGSSSPVRSTTPPEYPFDKSIFAELDNSLWIIPLRIPLGSEHSLRGNKSRCC